MSMKVLNPPGIQGEPGRPIRVSVLADSIYYVNRNKAIKTVTKTNESTIFPVQNLKLTTIKAFREGEFLAGDDSGNLVHFHEESQKIFTRKILSGQVNCIEIFGEALIVAGSGQKFQAKAIDFKRFCSQIEAIELFVVQGNHWPITCLKALSEDSFAFGKEDGSLHILDGNGKAIFSDYVDKSCINDLFLDSENQVLYFCSLSRAIGGLALKEHKVVFSDKSSFKGAVYGISALSAHRFLVSCSSDAVLRVWRTREDGLDFVYAIDLSEALIKPDVVLGMHVVEGDKVMALTLNANRILTSAIGPNSTFDIEAKFSFHKSPILCGLKLASDLLAIDSEGKVSLLPKGFMQEIAFLNKQISAAVICKGNLYFSTYNEVGCFSFSEKALVQNPRNVEFGIKNLLCFEEGLFVVTENAILSLTSEMTIAKKALIKPEISASTVSGIFLGCADKMGSLHIFDRDLNLVEKIAVCPGLKITALYFDDLRDLIIAGNSESELIFVDKGNFKVF